MRTRPQAELPSRQEATLHLVGVEAVGEVHDLTLRSAAGGPIGHFVLTDRAALKRQMAAGLTVAARCAGEVVGVLHVDFPTEEKNWAAKVGDPYSAAQLALMDIAAVLPEFRGRGLMGTMLACAEDHLLELEPLRVAWYGTVHPDNAASRRTFEAAGYEIAAQVSAYGGLPRLVMRKRAT